MNPKELSKLIGVSERSIYHWGQIGVVKFTINKLGHRDYDYESALAYHNRPTKFGKKTVEEKKETLRLARIRNKEKKKQWDKNHAKKFPEKIKVYKQRYKLKNRNNPKQKEKEHLQNKSYYIRHRDARRLYHKNYIKTNLKTILDKRKKRYKYDINYRIKINVRTRIHAALRSCNARKNTKTTSLLGCTIEQFKQHISCLFNKNMCWENYGTVWSIDHIVPCTAFDLSNEQSQKKCFNFKNLQPLLISDNSRKLNRVNIELIKTMDTQTINLLTGKWRQAANTIHNGYK